MLVLGSDVRADSHPAKPRAAIVRANTKWNVFKAGLPHRYRVIPISHLRRHTLDPPCRWLTLAALRTHSGSAYRNSNAVAQIIIKPPGFDDLPSRVQVPSSLLQLSSSFQQLLFRTQT